MRDVHCEPLQLMDEQQYHAAELQRRLECGYENSNDASDSTSGQVQ